MCCREALKRELSATQAELEASRGEVGAAKEHAAHEVALLRRQLTAAQASLADAEKTVEETRHQLSAEQAKTLKLEAQLAELRVQLGQVGELQKELDRYRKMASDAQKKSGGGLWGYISGQT